jgi:hypothetical protein
MPRDIDPAELSAAKTEIRVASKELNDAGLSLDVRNAICRLVIAARADEREVCAIAAVTRDADDPGYHETYGDGRRAAAEKIRQRNNQL